VYNTVVPTVFQKKKSAPSTAPIAVQSSMGPLTCFAVNPKGVRFETQEAGETVVLFLRQHIIVNLGWVILAVFMLLAPTMLFPMLIAALGIPITIPASYIVIGTLFWYLGTFGFILAKFLGWYFNIYIVTDERVVDIDFYYLLYKQFSQAELNKIQDISYASGGIFATFLNYGNVKIQTAGEMPNLEFDKVPYPERVVETIRNLLDTP
jgi:hypothetical protein